MFLFLLVLYMKVFVCVLGLVLPSLAIICVNLGLCDLAMWEGLHSTNSVFPGGVCKLLLSLLIRALLRLFNYL